jgi:ornithine cyclodeaminase/alanine dehydrogenase-like protein (mu-crystallin family)
MRDVASRTALVAALAASCLALSAAVSSGGGVAIQASAKASACHSPPPLSPIRLVRPNVMARLRSLSKTMMCTKKTIPACSSTGLAW